MSRDSGSGDPSQRTVAELLAEHGGGSQRGARRRRRRAEDPTETAPQAIIDRVNSDSGRMRAVVDEEVQGPTSQPPEAQAAPPPGPAPQAPPSEPPQASRAVPPPPMGSPVRPAEPPVEASSPPGGSNFWARRFGSAHGQAQADQDDGSQSQQSGEPARHAPDPDATAQQPSLAARTGAPAPQRPSPGFARGHAPNVSAASPSAPGAPAVEGLTEQFPLVDNDAPHPHADPGAAPGNGTALIAYPPEHDNSYGADAPYEQDPYGSGYYDSGYQAGYDDSYVDDSYVDDSYVEDSYVEDSYSDDSYGGDPYAVDDLDDEFDDAGAQQLPAGMGSEDYPASEFADDEEPAKSPAKEWLVLGTQVGAGLLAGGLVWVGFQWLWTALPVAALVAALVVTGALVLVARKILRTDDLQTILLAVLVGLVCTVSPAALLLVGY